LTAKIHSLCRNSGHAPTAWPLFFCLPPVGVSASGNPFVVVASRLKKKTLRIGNPAGEDGQLFSFFSWYSW
jgi:hypothetical protein